MQPVYHFISHSHWDREWYKTFETFRLDLVDMINSLLKILDTSPDYTHFILDGQTIVLQDYTEIMPERKADLQRHVQNNRISIGPWYILPDEFLVSGESTIRNLLFGRRVGEEYGQVMQVGYIPDSFSHLAMLPAILRGFDMDTAIVYRGFGGEPGQDKSEYCWRAAGGSEVLMIHLPPNGYGDAYIGKKDRKAFIEKGNALKAILDPRATTPHRLCMNGGDHHFPEPYLPEALRVMNENCEGNFIHSSIPDFVDAVKTYLHENGVELTRISGELHYGFRYAFAVQSGVYSSRMYIKQANHRCEKLLTRYVEPLAMWAELVGRKSLEPMLNQGWKLLLQNHPHDSICGCSIDPVHREMMARFKKCEQVGEAIIEKSLSHLYPDAWDGSENIFIFNPLFRPANKPVEAEIEFFRQKIVVGLNPNVHIEPPAPLISGFRLVDENENEVLFQVLSHDPEAHGLRYSDYSYPSKRLVERFTLLVETKSIPALGFNRYKVERTEKMPSFENRLQASNTFLENGFVRIDVHTNGSLTITDKRNNHTFRGFHIFEDGGDAGDEYNYSYPLKDGMFTSQNENAEITLIETGPLRVAVEICLNLRVPAGLEASRKQRNSDTIALPIVTRIYLYHNQPWIECETTVRNQAKDHRLRVLFPTGFHTNRSYADSQFCITERQHTPVNPEEFSIEVPAQVHPMQRGVTALDGERGMTIASAGLPEYELKADEPGTLAMTLLRCVGRLSGGDLLTRPGGEAGWITHTPEAQCPGTHTFRYAIIPHSKNEFLEYGCVNEQIESFLIPCLSVRRGGEQVERLSRFGLHLSPPSLVVSAIKPAENGDGHILRVYNPTQREISGKLDCASPLQHVCLTQLDERDSTPLAIENLTTVSFKAAPFQIVSLRLQFAN